MKLTFTGIMLACLFTMSCFNQTSAQNARELRENGENSITTETDREGYCIPKADCSYGDGLTSFEFAGIQNLNSGCSTAGYGDFTSQSGSVEIGQTYVAKLTSGYDGQFVTIWVDYNDDKAFSSTEIILKDYEITAAKTEFSVPVSIDNGIAGTFRMRIGVNYGEPSSPDACANFTYGEYEDYTLVMKGASINLNAKMLSFDMYPIQAKGSIKPSVTVVNKGFTTASFPVVCKDINGTYTSTKQVENLKFGEEKSVEFDAWNIASGKYTLSIETQLAGDEMPGDDQVSPTITVIDYAPEKKVLAEEATGTWCGWCVRGIVYMDSMVQKYPDSFIGIAVHGGDPMEVKPYITGLGKYISGYPGGVVGRRDKADPSQFEIFYKKQIKETAIADIKVKNAVVDRKTNKVTFEVESKFLADATGYLFNAAIVENHIKGDPTNAKWNQANYYSGGKYGNMGGFEDKPNPIPAADIEYMDVARAILGAWNGVPSSLPSELKANQTYTYKFTADFDTAWNANNVHIVAMLIDQSNGTVMNANQTKDITITGIKEQTEDNQIRVYPNPASDNINIATDKPANSIFVYDSNGRLVKQVNSSSLIKHITLGDLTSGIYLIKVHFNDSQVTKKFVVE